MACTLRDRQTVQTVCGHVETLGDAANQNCQRVQVLFQLLLQYGNGGVKCRNRIALLLDVDLRRCSDRTANLDQRKDPRGIVRNRFREAKAFLQRKAEGSTATDAVSVIATVSLSKALAAASALADAAVAWFLPQKSTS